MTHPHAGGYIEFEDEIEQVTLDIPFDVAASASTPDTSTLWAWIR